MSATGHARTGSVTAPQPLRSLADAALDLTAASTVEAVLRVATEAAVARLGAERGAGSRLVEGADGSTHVAVPEATSMQPPPSALAAPLIGRGGTELGALALASRRDGVAFGDEDQAVLVQLAQLASNAIESI